jgi:predicted dehydrogenase
VAFQIRNPNSFTWVSSGFFVDWHCHNVDVACWAKGAWPVSAQGMAGRSCPEAGNQFDHFAIEYTFPDGTKLYSFSRHMSGCWETYADYAHGSKGSAVIMSSLADPKPKIYSGQEMSPEKIVWQRREPDCNPYQDEWQLLLDAIRGNKEHNEVRRACQASIAAIMGRAAAHTGGVVTWDQAMNSDFRFVADIDGLTFEKEAPIHEGPDGLYPAPRPGATKEI